MEPDESAILNGLFSVLRVFIAGLALVFAAHELAGMHERGVRASAAEQRQFIREAFEAVQQTPSGPQIIR